MPIVKFTETGYVRWKVSNKTIPTDFSKNCHPASCDGIIGICGQSQVIDTEVIRFGYNIHTYLKCQLGTHTKIFRVNHDFVTIAIRLVLFADWLHLLSLGFTPLILEWELLRWWWHLLFRLTDTKDRNFWEYGKVCLSLQKWCRISRNLTESCKLS